MDLSVGKIRGLQQLANEDGIFVMCAMDHRGSLKKMLDEDCPECVSYRTMVNYKLDLCRALAPHSSAVLLDPAYGAAQAIAAGVLPGSTGLLVSMEATGYMGAKGQRITELLPGWSIAKVKRLGASAAKILLYYRPDLPEIAQRQLDTAAKLARECLKAELPFLVEPKTYRVESQEPDPAEFARAKPDLVIETARQVSDLPIDVLKIEFPTEPDYEADEQRLLKLCREVDAASRVPWVILSGGVDFETFHRQVRIACEAGASGFLAGRALWQEATPIRSRRQRMKFLETTVAGRLIQLSRVASTLGTPWHAKLGARKNLLAPVSEGWYEHY